MIVIVAVAVARITVMTILLLSDLIDGGVHSKRVLELLSGFCEPESRQLRNLCVSVRPGGVEVPSKGILYVSLLVSLDSKPSKYPRSWHVRPSLLLPSTVIWNPSTHLPNRPRQNQNKAHNNGSYPGAPNSPK